MTEGHTVGVNQAPIQLFNERDDCLELSGARDGWRYGFAESSVAPIKRETREKVTQPEGRQ